MESITAKLRDMIFIEGKDIKNNNEENIIYRQQPHLYERYA